MFQKMNFRWISNSFFRNGLLVFYLFIIFFFPRFGYSQNTQELTALELNDQIIREISAGQKHSFKITMAANQFAAATVEQREIDVSIAVLGLDGKAFVRRDSILKNDGLEKIEFVALDSGVYVIEIEANPRASQKAGNYAVRLEEKRDSTEKERRLEEARKLHNESIRLYNDGEYNEGLELGNRALTIREQESGEDDIDVASTLANIALILSQKGETEKAVTLLQRSLNIREKAFGTFHPDVARTMHNLAYIYVGMGRFQEAISFYEKTIEIREKVLGPENAELATTYHNLGQIYSNLAEYEKSEEFLFRAIEIKEKVLPPTSPSIAASLSMLAGVFSEKGDEDKALELYQKALSIREKALPPGHPDIARSLEYLGASYMTKRDFQQAEACFLRGLDILNKKFAPAHYRIARMLGNLAVLYHMQGDYGKAEPLFRETVEMLEKTVGNENQDFATALYNMAWFYTDKGDYDLAEPLYKQALVIAEKNFGSQHPDVIEYLNGLARNYQAKGQTSQSVNLLIRSHSLSERNAQAMFFTSSEKQKLLYLNTLSGETNQYLSAHLKFAPDDPKALELALTSLFERKGRVSDALTFEFAVLRNRFDDKDRALLDDLKKVTSELAKKILIGAGGEITPDEHQKQVRELEEQKEKIEQEISRTGSEFRSRIQTVKISSIQSAIPENTALIEYGTYRPYDPKAISNNEQKAFGEPRYVVYIIQNKGEIKWKDLGTIKQIDEAVEAFRQALRDPKREDVRTLARSIDEKIMEPVRALAGDAKHLLISADGELNLIPFESLINEKGSFLIENFSFTYLTSGRDLLRMQTPRESKSKPLVIANPIFGEPLSDQMAKATTKKSNGRQKRRSVTVTRNMSDTYFAPLAGTAEEARSIKALFPEAEFLTEARATESAVKRTNAPQILHIATHGFFLEDSDFSKDAKTRIENPLLRSGLALAGANHRANSSGEDGILTALEASGLNLWGTKLVVLSACDTGLGEVKNGEGVYGLRRAFVLSGTETLVMSLWAVSDLVTREIMTSYYKNLKQGMGRGEALRQVQLEMLKKNNRRHPFYWASFIQSGEWANLEGKR